MVNRVCALFVVFLLLTLSGLESCSSKDEETTIRELVKKGAKLGEEQDIKGLMNLTTEDFLALPGDLGRQETRRILFVAFRHYQDFKILYPRPNVELKPDKRSASAVFPFLIVKKETVLPKLKELYEDPQRWLGNGGRECGPLPAETRMGQAERGLAGETGPARKIHRPIFQRLSRLLKNTPIYCVALIPRHLRPAAVSCGDSSSACLPQAGISGRLVSERF